MAANIDSMMYYGKKPWHELGTKVEHAATSAEAIKSAGLDWSVRLADLITADGIKVSDHFAVVREDRNISLGVVGARYELLQNQEAFSLTDAIVGEKAAMYHTAGALGNGERIWLLVKLPGHIRVVGDDVANKFLLFTSSHDGSAAVTTMLTPIRVVCQNTLNVALSGNEPKFRAKHTMNLGNKIAQARQVIGLAEESFNLFEQAAQTMARKNIVNAELAAISRKALSIPDNVKYEDIPTRTQNMLADISRLFDAGKGQDLPGAKGTAWGAYNAVTEYVDYVRGKDLEKRATSLLFGSGAMIKQRAFDSALTLAK